MQGLQAIRCPAGLYFDIEKQTCDWKEAVKNCKLKNKERKVKPLLITDEPLCQDGFLACGDGNCIERGLFCNGEKDCTDGSDENSCGKCHYQSTGNFPINNSTQFNKFDIHFHLNFLVPTVLSFPKTIHLK